MTDPMGSRNMGHQKTPKPQEILVVEDTPASLQFLLNLLSEAGFLVRPASSGPLALRSVSVRQPDLILLDVKMPHMDGYQVCRRLKAMEQIRDIPVIFLSALVDADDKVKGFEAGGVDYITKPFEPRDVLARIKLHLRLRELTEHLEQEVARRTQELTRANQQLEKEIAERKQVAKDLRVSEIRYRGLFEDSPISLWEEDFSEGRTYYDRLRASGVTDFRSYFRDHPEEVAHCAGLVKVLDVNKATLDLFRADNKQDLLTGLPTIFTPQSLEVFREEVVNLFEGGRHFKGEVIQRTLTGEEIIAVIQYSVAPGYEDSWGKVVVSLLDITERKQAEEALSWEAQVNLASAELSRNLLSTMSIDDITYMTLEHAKHLTGSAFGYVGYIDQETGYLVCPTLTRDIWEQCNVADKEIVFKEFTGLWGWVLNNRRSLLSNAPGDDPRSSGTPPGHMPIHRFLSAPALIGETLVGQVSVTNAEHDYTDSELEVIERLANLYAIAIQRQQAEEEIKRYRNHLEELVKDRTMELEAANKELESFAYSVSHDLRAPLRHIDGFIDLLQQRAGKSLDEQGRHYMDIISEAAQKMGLLIDNLLSFSRMARHAFSSQLVELEPLVREVISELEPDASGRNIEWRIGNLPAVSGDAAMLRIVLSNLISNALKFTRPCQQARIEIGSLPERTSEAVIYVRDNGIGFDMTYVDKLFDVFQRLHSANEFEGTGIGLANVRRIIDRHGGRTWAEGNVGQGATFYFSLSETL